MSRISNEDMIIAIESEDNQKIMARACKKFACVLNADEIESCKLNALWKALETYDPNMISRRNTKKSKFTSYLFRGVQLECKTAIKFIIAGRRGEALVHDNIGLESDVIASIELRDEISKTEYGEILEEVYFNGLTTKELSKKFKVSKQIICIRKKRALNSLKARLLSV